MFLCCVSIRFCYHDPVMRTIRFTPTKGATPKDMALAVSRVDNVFGHRVNIIGEDNILSLFADIDCSDLQCILEDLSSTGLFKHAIWIDPRDCMGEPHWDLNMVPGQPIELDSFGIPHPCQGV